MRRGEAHAVARLVAEALGQGGRVVEQTHLAIAARVFRHTPAPPPVRLLHDGIARAVHGGVRGGLRGAALAAATVTIGRVADGRPLDSDRRGAVVLAALNGLWGDRIAERFPQLALGMAVRRHGSDVPLDREAVRAAFPDATSRVAVFLHGLCETEEAWRLVPGQPERSDRRTYGERLQDELSYTPVDVRYNTGRHVSDNGRALARLLDGLIAAWPVGVEEIVLVGHSMGGLVARGACHHGDLRGARFAPAVRHVFCLGTPDLGADVERGLGALVWALGRLPETRAIAELLDARSAGIRDLGLGSLADEDPSGHDAGAFLRDRGSEMRFLAEANLYFVERTRSHGPLGQLLAGVHPLALLNHPEVYEQIRASIVRGRRRPLARLPAPATLALLPA